MKISIIVVAYNVEDYVERCMKSVIKSFRKYIDYEVVVIDDGSTDDTSLILERFTTDPNIKYISIIHSGLGAARNFGLKIAKGDFVIFVDGDDVLSENCLVELNESLKGDSQTKLVIFQWQSISERGEYIGDPQGGPLLDQMFLTCWNKCYKKKFIDSFAFPENVLYEDVGFAIRAFREAGIQIKYIPSALYLHRNNPNGITRRKQSFSERLDCLKGFEQLLVRFPKDEEIKYIVIKTVLNHLKKSIKNREVITTDNLDFVNDFFNKYALYELSLQKRYSPIFTIKRTFIRFFLHFKNIRIIYYLLFFVC